ncbi:ribbon-helix-helix domain-containing protein [Sphaerisporangium corydalis]|uniref:CopG family transcriptional regulator n=1 Tax=Sphaerisporangium corydalis TaxID=1441875 RepID=A0ABV9EMM3_9ACTN|nr:CopG family transcriptional regulator [Sphaerisporangium corydalis]
MSMRRTSVYADQDDLALIREAARRRGVPQAEIIRVGIRLAAMAGRVWDDEPFAWPSFEGSGEPVTREEIPAAIEGPHSVRAVR